MSLGCDKFDFDFNLSNWSLFVVVGFFCLFVVGFFGQVKGVKLNRRYFSQFRS